MSEMGSGSCANCGKPLAGAFCAHCGTRALSPSREGWGVVASELFDAQTPRGHLSALASFLRAPVDTIIGLTLDPSYRSHWGFLSICLFTQLTLGFVILPHLLTHYYPVPGIENKSAVLTNQIVQYVGLAILTPIQFYVCRAAGTIARTPGLYVKLCVLSISFGAILSIIANLAFWGIGVASTTLGQPADPRVSGPLITLAVLASVLVFVTLSHKRFWGMKWWVAAPLTVLFALLSWGVVYPALMWGMTASGLGKLLDDLLP